MKKESVVLVVVAAALVAFGAGRLSKNVAERPQVAPEVVAEGAAAAAPGAAPSANGIPANMPWKGAANGLVTIVEVSDFQCPFCSRVGPTLKKLTEAYPNDVKIVWANQPLPFHDKAKGAAIAAAAAHRQGKFWEMHDKLFANQQQLSDANYDTWAKEIGLDVEKFKKDKADPALASQVDREQAAANATGARGTPAFFINGKLLSGAQPFEQFDAAVKEALAEAKTVAAGGKTGLDLMQAIAEKRDPAVGGKVVAYFLKGEAPAAAPAEAPAAAGGEKEDDGPAVAPPDSLDVWKVPVDPKRDSVKGDSSKALVTIVEISDFECPFCSRGANTVTEVEKFYGDKVRLVFKHHPLPFHKNARGAHAAAIAAGKQGKFWEFHDKAFANAQALTEENFLAWAKEIGLNVDKFNTDRKDPSAEAHINEDMEMAGGVGIRGTPGFFINGRKIVGAQPLGVFKAVIDEEIKKAEGAGKKGAAYYDEIIAKGKVFSELGDTAADLKLDGLPFKGPKDAPVTITVYSDFQCPYCSRVAGPIEEFMKNPEFAGKVKVVFAHYPLSFHNMAKPASVAAQEAFEQGGPDLFWKLHDALFAAQRELSEDKIKELAKAAGVDMAKLDAAIASKKHEALIDKTMENGTKGGVEGTPSLFINGRKWEPQTGFSPEAFAKAAKLAMAKK
jgi:protein-disulfide isomerase